MGLIKLIESQTPDIPSYTMVPKKCHLWNPLYITLRRLVQSGVSLKACNLHTLNFFEFVNYINVENT